VEVEVEGDAPGETETVTQSVEIQEMMKCRKLMKDLAYTIRDIRKLGIEVDVLEGIDNPSLLDRILCYHRKESLNYSKALRPS
jgi:hypothetical protein